MADEAPPAVDAADEPDDEPGSFFALLMARTREPYRLPDTVVEYEDDEGPWSARLAVTIDPPDDDQVATLDNCGSALAELEVLAGDQFDDLLDVLDVRGTSPVAAADEVLEHFGLSDPPEIGWHELVERINVYGRGLEYDLWERGRSLAAYFRGEGEGWDELLRIAARLPPGSHYRSAQLADDELAARIAEKHGPPSSRKKGSSRPPLEGFSTEVAYLHRIENRLHFLGWAVFAAQAGRKRGSPPKPTKGPETADDRYEFADFMREHEEIVGQVLKRKGGSKKRAEPEPARTPAPEAVRGAVLLGEPIEPNPDITRGGLGVPPD